VRHFRVGARSAGSAANQARGRMATEIGIEGVLLGHHTDVPHGTGCTVILVPDGAMAAIEVRGGGPGTRDTEILSPNSSITDIHAVLLTGGSGFGLAAADGVVRYLEEKGLGHETPWARVPLVPSAVIFDLAVSGGAVRPGPKEGYEAAAAACATVVEGSVGVGTGATVGKLYREAGWMKGGFGWSALDVPGPVRCSAFAAVNSWGDVVGEHGEILAGARGSSGFVNTQETVLSLEEHTHFGRMQNTTLSVVVTDACLSKNQCYQVARMAHDGIARAVAPAHTPVDGDAVFVLSVGAKQANVFQLGVVAAEVTARAIRRAVLAATSLDGVPAARDLPAGWGRGPDM
jgi:L-aminopeptidase/D-esterase-like protein